jgi:hypothetical protein
MIPTMSGNGSGPSGPAAVTAPRRVSPIAPTTDGPGVEQLRKQWNAYQGDFGAAGKLAPLPDSPDLNVASNRIKPMVNVGVDFLFGPMLSIKCSDDAAQAIFSASWGDDDQRMVLLSKCGITGGVYGHTFVKVIAPRRGVASATNPPRLVLLNSENLTIQTDPDDCDVISAFVITYLSKDAKGADLRVRQTITRVDPDDDDASIATGEDGDTTWSIQNSQAAGRTGGQFVNVGPAIPWPYPLPPIIDWQNYPAPNTHWGQPDVTLSLVDLNTQLRIIESNINTIGFLQGHAILYSTGADTGGIKPTPGRIIDLGAADAKLSAVTSSGDLAQLMAFAEALRGDMDEESGVPGVATNRIEALPRGTVSGVAVRLLYATLLARTEHKRRLYGQGIRQICQTVLLLCGWRMEDINALTIELGWQEPLPQDDLAMGQLALALQQIGWSQHSLITMTGGDPDMEAEYMKEEGQAKVNAVAKGMALPPVQPPPAPGTPPPPAPQESGEGTNA